MSESPPPSRPSRAPSESAARSFGLAQSINSARVPASWTSKSSRGQNITERRSGGVVIGPAPGGSGPRESGLTAGLRGSNSPAARAVSGSLLPDSPALRASSPAFNVGSVRQLLPESPENRGRMMKRLGADIAAESIAASIVRYERDLVPRTRSVEPTPTTSIRASDLSFPGSLRRFFLVRNLGSITDFGAQMSSLLEEASLIPGDLRRIARDDNETNDDDDEPDGDDGVARPAGARTGPGGDEPDESAPLLGHRRHRKQEGRTSTTAACLILLKGFVGTGILFLPRAFLNGGWMFSLVGMFIVAILSLICFLQLVNLAAVRGGSLAFGALGRNIYGPWFEVMINASLAISQIGFASAYTVFVAENIQASVSALTGGRTVLLVPHLIAFQAVVYTPMALYRDLKSLKKTSLFGNVFIGVVLASIFYYDYQALSTRGPGPGLQAFNSEKWSLFVGSSIYSFEGIGVLLDVRSMMKKPEQLPTMLTGLVAVMTAVFVTVGAVSYTAFGSETKTVVLMNLPQDSKAASLIQLTYSLAILMSTPVQIFPAAEISCQYLFDKAADGSVSLNVKWRKNAVRAMVVVVSSLVAYLGAANLEKFVAIIGSFACIPLVYIYPPLMDLKHTLTMEQDCVRSRLRILMSGSIAAIGLVMLVYTSVLNFGQ